MTLCIKWNMIITIVKFIIDLLFIMLVIKNNQTNDSLTQIKWLNYGEWLSIRTNLDLKPYYNGYKSLLFYEELDRMKFSLCNQYFTIRVSIIVFFIIF